MLVVKIELWPHGDESRAKEIGRVEIANDGTLSDGSGNSKFGNYDARLLHAGRFFGKPGTWRRGRVTNHARELSPYHLVYRAIKSALGL